MSNGNSIIDIGNISKPVTVFVEKISGAIGIVYEPTRIVRKAKAEAEAERIKVLAGIETSELEQRAIARLVQEESKKQENIEAITAQAANKLTEQAKPEEMDNDWIVHCLDKCRNVSDKEMQGLWSNILSGEANTPGTYSKRTLDIVSSLDKKEAHLFTVLCGFAILDEKNFMFPLILDIKNEIYSKAGLNFWGLTHLETIGFIKLNHTTGFSLKAMPKVTIFNYHEMKVKFEFRKDLDNNLHLGEMMLTESGRQLSLICGSKMNPEFIGYAMEYYNKRNKVGDAVSMTIVE